MNQPAEFRIPQIILQVKGTANTRVSDDRGEDLGTLDIVPLPGASAEHVGRLWVVFGGEAGRHGVPEQLEEVGVDPVQSILGGIKIVTRSS